MGADMDMDLVMDTVSVRTETIETRSVSIRFWSFSRFVSKEPNKKSVFRNKPKLKINTFDMGVDMDMDMAICLLFRFVLDGLWAVRLYRNTETNCFDITMK
jgi:hypothetical protein